LGALAAPVPDRTATPQHQRGHRAWAPGCGVGQRPHRQALPGRWAHRATINHALSTVSGFYDYAVEVGLGPLVNPVPRSRADRERAFAHRSHDVPEHRGPRAPYRQKTQMRIPRQLPDELFSELFARLPSNRDRAIIATAVSSGARASELLSMRPVDVHCGEQTIDVIPKCGRHRTPVRASPDAFMWLTLHLAEHPPGHPVRRCGRRVSDRPGR